MSAIVSIGASHGAIRNAELKPQSLEHLAYGSYPFSYGLPLDLILDVTRKKSHIPCVTSASRLASPRRSGHRPLVDSLDGSSLIHPEPNKKSGHSTLPAAVPDR